jgi:hypothetical protein
MATAKSYRVLTPYLAWAYGARRAEQGEVIDDFPKDDVAQALRDGWIEEVTELPQRKTNDEEQD